MQRKNKCLQADGRLRCDCAFLTELKAVANRACEAAVKEKQNIAGAINWADLCCVRAEYAYGDSGGEFLRVYVEEASPGEEELQRFIANHLEGCGYPAVSVVTEW